MSRFATPRTATDLAAVVWGGHNDTEISKIESEALLRRLRAHVDLLAGSTSDEESREQVVEDSLIGILRSIKSEEFSSLEEFEAHTRKMLAKRYK